MKMAMSLRPIKWARPLPPRALIVKESPRFLMTTIRIRYRSSPRKDSRDRYSKLQIAILVKVALESHRRGRICRAATYGRLGGWHAAQQPV
jgi:hypothetical protein